MLLEAKMLKSSKNIKKFKFIIFIIPYHHIGGAERVHLNIIKSLRNKPFIFFPNLNKSDVCSEFGNAGHCFRLNSHKRKKATLLVLNFFSRFFELKVFGCNNLFFYDAVVLLKNKTYNIDLTHAFSYPDKGIETESLVAVPYLHKRIVINEKTFFDYKKLYFEAKIDKEYLSRFQTIQNGIKIVPFKKELIHKRFLNFTIGFVGRNSLEKRPRLFFDIAKLASVKAKVIGDNFNDFKNDFPNVVYFENCKIPELIKEQFSEISLLIVTSSREGFPLVIMEAMELGIPVISTAVGSIAEHLTNGKNGFITSLIKENDIINFVIDKINYIIDNEEVYLDLSLNARQHAIRHFDNKIFEQKYQKLFYE